MQFLVQLEPFGQILGGQVLPLSVDLWEAFLTVFYVFKLVEFTALLRLFLVSLGFYFADFCLASLEVPLVGYFLHMFVELEGYCATSIAYCCWWRLIDLLGVFYLLISIAKSLEHLLRFWTACI